MAMIDAERLLGNLLADCTSTALSPHKRVILLHGNAVSASPRFFSMLELPHAASALADFRFVRQGEGAIFGKRSSAIVGILCVSLPNLLVGRHGVILSEGKIVRR
jgi:hypothetical protein